ncbi:Uncharacterised protein [Mycobacteroides abscessus subsp. abscessus]|uniref:hypothetical protein n=1 Tax=Mycobacteroides abscessus TaxID=36809 RepID=UPI000926CB57|nr:hypothetical protein [Mycobacteroides abscessus]SHU69045.1 Uncharacterised protein [Mycobacteroides abscessus subsp. abscessus]
MPVADQIIAVPTLRNTVPFNDTSGWLAVHPGMTDQFIQELAARRDRAPYAAWINDSTWRTEDSFNWEYELSTSLQQVLWSEIDIWDVFAHPDKHRALYLLASDRYEANMTLYTVLESTPLADVLIDPKDPRYTRLRELCAAHGSGPIEPATEQRPCGADIDDRWPRAKALATAERILNTRDEFAWLIQWMECLGTTDPIIALALRPFIGQYEGWDQTAYDALRRDFETYRAELLHPEDQPLSGITYRDQQQPKTLSNKS